MRPTSVSDAALWFDRDVTVSIRDVAAEARVSVGTVSNVLNSPEKVSPATVARVQGAIDRLGFVRNDAARQLRAGESRCVGLVVLDVGNPFFTDIARSAERRAAEHNLTVLLGTSDDDAFRERTYLDTFDELRVLGMLVSPVGSDLSRLEAMRSRGTPVVLVDRDGTGTPFSSVSVDDVAGGQMAAEHLLRTGRRRLACVGGPASLRQVLDRRRGAALAVAETPGADLEYVETRSLSIESGRAVAESLCARSRSERPDAIFCANDLVALGLQQGFTLAGGIRVPDDVAVIGYDDIAFARSSLVPLSSIGQPAEQIGVTALDLLLATARGEHTEPVHEVLEPTLVVRDSTAVR